MCSESSDLVTKMCQRYESNELDDDSGSEAVLVSTQLHGKFVRFVRLFRRRDRHLR